MQGHPNGQVMVESSDKTWSTGEDVKPEDEHLRSVGVQYASEKEQRNSSKKNEEAGPTWKCHSAVGVSVEKVKSDPVKNIAQESEMLGL